MRLATGFGLVLLMAGPTGAFCGPVDTELVRTPGFVAGENGTFLLAGNEGVDHILDQARSLAIRDGLPLLGELGTEVLSVGRSGHGAAPSTAVLESAELHRLVWDLGTLKVEYLAEAGRLRQNLWVMQRPAGEGRLEVTLDLRTDLEAFQAASDVIMFRDDKARTVFEYQDLLVTDARGEQLTAGMRLEQGPEKETRLVLWVDDPNAAYPVLIDPIVSTPSVSLIATQIGATMGQSVASAGDLNGDGYSDLVVGLPGTDLGQTDEGAAYVYYGGPSGIPTTPDVIIQSNVATAQLGFSVSTAGDVNGDGYSDLAVGAWRWQSTGAELREGAVFVHYGSATGISATPDVILQTDHAGDFMGVSVACAGDVNADGYSDIIAGGHVANYGQTEEGAAFIFLGGPAGISTTYANRLERNRSFTQFGRAVAGAGDLNGDGYSDVVVGAHNYNNVVTDDGAAFVYYGGPSGISGGLNAAPDVQLFGDPIADASLGWSVGCAGDLNGDGYSELAVGAYKSNNGQSEEGLVHLYYGSATGVAATPDVVLESNQADAWFGRAVGTAGDLDGDGYSELVVGAPHWTSGQPLEGAVFIYYGGPAMISAPQDQRIERNSSGANLGECVITAGDLNGDGISELVMGAPLYGNGGAAFVHEGRTIAVSNSPSDFHDGIVAGEARGSTVATAGDVNGDGYTDVLIGAPSAASGGVLHVFYGTSTGLPAAPDLSITGASVGASPGFATDACTAGDVNGDGYADVIAGAPASGPGRALVFMGSPGGLASSPAVTLTHAIGQFGRSVSSAGDIDSDGYGDVIVGSNGNGAVVFRGGPGGVITTPHQVLTGASVGHDVCTAGDVNGDGYSDVAATQRAGIDAAVVWYGSDTGLVDAVRVAIPIPSNSGAGQALLGASCVAGGGDVNGDGFDELVLGLPDWENSAGTPDEGCALVHYGSSSGIQTTGASTLQSNQANANMGAAVAAAGDMNGDGYADLLIGLPLYDQTLTDEGHARLHLGRNPTITPSAAATIRGAETGAELGLAVAGAGDVNGDGYSDILVGAPLFDSGAADAGRTVFGYGNEGGNIDRLTRQYQADLVNPLATNCMDFADPDHFGIGHFARSPIQRNAVRMHWEVVFEGQAFSGSPITSGQGNTGVSAAAIDIGAGGTEIKQLIYKTPNFIRYKWRVRLEYDKAKLIDGQPFSRWFYGYASGYGDIGVLPVELLTIAAAEEGAVNRVSWATATESNSSVFEVERSMDGSTFEHIGTVPAAGNSLQTIDYAFFDDDPGALTYYRLRMVDHDGTWEHSPMVSIFRRSGVGGHVFPVPAVNVVYVPLPDLPMGGSADLLDGLGRRVRSWELSPATSARSEEFPIGDLPAGSYTMQVLGKDGHVLKLARVVKQ